MRARFIVGPLLGCALMAAKPAHHAAPATPAPVVPPAAPPAAVIPPPDLAPPHPTAPPPPPVVHDDAPGAATRTTTGMLVSFGADRSDLNPGSLEAVRGLAKLGRDDARVVYNLYAHAPGSSEDQSTPRRLSLERGLTVRSALVNAGIASTRVYVHAMGPAHGDAAPADRVDITLATRAVGPPAPAATATPGPAKSAPPVVVAPGKAATP